MKLRERINAFKEKRREKVREETKRLESEAKLYGRQARAEAGYLAEKNKLAKLKQERFNRSTAGRVLSSLKKAKANRKPSSSPFSGGFGGGVLGGGIVQRPTGLETGGLRPQQVVKVKRKPSKKQKTIVIKV